MQKFLYSVALIPPLMDNRAQISLEYMIMIAVALTLAALATLLTVNVLSIKDGLKTLIANYRAKLI